VDANYYRSLTRKMVLTVLVVSFTPMFLVSSIILYQFRHSYQEKVHAYLVTLVKKHTQRIDTFLKEKQGDIRLLAKTFCYEELVNESFLQDRLVMLQEEFGPVFVDLGVVNDQGLQVAYAGPFKLGKALYWDADWFQKAMKSEVFISDVFLGLRGLPHFIIAVRENWNGRTWILRATVDFVAFNALVEAIRVGQTGFAFILNRKGEFQTKPSQAIAPTQEPFVEFLKAQDSDESQVFIGEREDPSGVEHIYVASFLKDGNWLLVYQQTTADAFSDLRNAIRVAFLIMFLGGMGIVSMALILSRRMVNRIAEADKEKQSMDEQIIETGKLASVGELAAGIAHEINNPVAIMVEEAGWIEDLLEEEDFREGKNLDEFRRALKQIRTQGVRCKGITHKLLSFARKTDAKLQEVQINDLIEELVGLSAQRAKYANVTIETHLQTDRPMVQISQSELQQVFLNLINNALDAMEKTGGALTIRTQFEKEQPAPMLIVEFADTGCGIPRANLPRIFDPFFTTKPVGKGTGLGLSICYGIIKKMGGDIEVRSTVDVGTTFRVKIPVPAEPQA
jgi:two-component system NtrC family sensor kinase